MYPCVLIWNEYSYQFSLITEVKNLKDDEEKLTKANVELRRDIQKAEYSELRQRANLSKISDKFSNIEKNVEV